MIFFFFLMKVLTAFVWRFEVQAPVRHPTEHGGNLSGSVFYIQGISPCEIVKKKNEAGEKGKFKPLKASNTQQTRGTAPCVSQHTKRGVCLAERGRPRSWVRCEQGWVPLLVMLMLYSSPCVLAPAVTEALKTLRNPNNKQSAENVRS